MKYYLKIHTSLIFNEREVTFTFINIRITLTSLTFSEEKNYFYLIIIQLTKNKILL